MSPWALLQGVANWSLQGLALFPGNEGLCMPEPLPTELRAAAQASGGPAGQGSAPAEAPKPVGVMWQSTLFCLPDELKVAMGTADITAPAAAICLRGVAAVEVRPCPALGGGRAAARGSKLWGWLLVVAGGGLPLAAAAWLVLLPGVAGVRSGAAWLKWLLPQRQGSGPHRPGGQGLAVRGWLCIPLPRCASVCAMFGARRWVPSFLLQTAWHDPSDPPNLWTLLQMGRVPHCWCSTPRCSPPGPNRALPRMQPPSHRCP